MRTHHFEILRENGQIENGGNVIWYENGGKMDNEYKSLLSWYSFIMLMAFTIGLQLKWSLIIWFLNHTMVIIAFYIERYRLRKYFKKEKFNMYQYGINEMSNYYWKLSRLVKNGCITNEIEVNIRTYLLSYKLIYLLGLLNFISIFIVARFNTL